MGEYMLEKSWETGIGAFFIQSDALTKAAGQLDREQFARAVKALSRAERISASGCGHSGIACMHFAHLMCCIERPARFIPPSEAVHGALGFVKSGDVMLLASRGGATDELLPILRICKDKGAVVIAVTENGDSPLAQGADIWLKMSVTREVDRNNSQGTTSFSVMCALFDALQAAMIEETGYTDERFAVIHPGGAVGKRLNQ